jgi:hypothetical protein
MSTAIRSRFFGLTAAHACCFSQTALAQDVPEQKLGAAPTAIGYP